MQTRIEINGIEFLSAWQIQETFDGYCVNTFVPMPTPFTSEWIIIKVYKKNGGNFVIKDDTIFDWFQNKGVNPLNTKLKDKCNQYLSNYNLEIDKLGDVILETNPNNLVDDILRVIQGILNCLYNIKV